MCLAGADIKEMANKTFVEAYKSNMFANWGDIAKVSKPVRCSKHCITNSA